jgi:hypothetical protein
MGCLFFVVDRIDVYNKAKFAELKLTDEKKRGIFNRKRNAV